MIEVRVPDEQEGTKAVVRAWLKKVGDQVAENDPLVELETDKVTQEVPAPTAGGDLARHGCGCGPGRAARPYPDRFSGGGWGPGGGAFTPDRSR